ncbi:hypothetical protein BV394_07060 [Brevirhabdus pacifica]|uniref:Uncharacterized protein n=2 Tax=Brevirhabdus pacifica TaxID=1267768 RepID=A0A1U7DHY5_9RHOB|nr:hypothetical protein [Brevirhabdus pacifica]APX89503.1 hypothetical protein BV394_07060 [Brevirhabdus pacifica]OWU76489.1 hypothetical protein ATO5_09240 [Loktanella sp. 22II-4b]PJJ85844.1 hypothetical protein CLV77_0374 [Brevirhabdus pacifica]
MTVLRTLVFMGLSIAAVPYVLLNGMGGGAARAPVAGTASALPAEVVDHRRLGDLEREARARERRHVSAVFDPDSLGPARVVTFATVVSLADLLAPGEAPPPPALEDLYAEARAARHMQAECTALLASFARRCVVQEAGAERMGDGRWRLQASLAFSPRDEIGAIPMEGAEYTPWRTRMRLKAHVAPMPPEDLARARADYYQHARRICAAIRGRSGNCVIERIEFTATPAAGPGYSVTLGARARFATLDPPGPAETAPPGEERPGLAPDWGPPGTEDVDLDPERPTYDADTVTQGPGPRPHRLAAR